MDRYFKLKNWISGPWWRFARIYVVIQTRCCEEFKMHRYLSYKERLGTFAELAIHKETTNENSEDNQFSSHEISSEEHDICVVVDEDLRAIFIRKYENNNIYTK